MFLLEIPDSLKKKNPHSKEHIDSDKVRNKLINLADCSWKSILVPD